MQLPAIREDSREEEERRSLIQDKEEEQLDDLLIKEPMIMKKENEGRGDLVKEVKTFPLQEIWHQFEKQEEAEGQKTVRGGRAFFVFWTSLDLSDKGVLDSSKNLRDKSLGILHYHQDHSHH